MVLSDAINSIDRKRGVGAHEVRFGPATRIEWATFGLRMASVEIIEDSVFQMVSPCFILIQEASVHSISSTDCRGSREFEQLLAQIQRMGWGEPLPRY
jgi:hypothetical protein